MAATPGYVPAGAYWGTIQTAAENHAGTAAVWQAISAQHLLETGTVPRFQFAEVNRLYATAVANRNAAEAFAAAPYSAAVGPEHVGRLPNAPAAGVPQASRRYIVQFQHVVDRAGVQETVWRTTEFAYGLPATKSGVMNQLTSDAALITNDYEDETHLGFGQIRMLAA